MDSAAAAKLTLNGRRSAAALRLGENTARRSAVLTTGAFGTLAVFLAIEMSQIGEPLIAKGVPSPWLLSTIGGLLAVGIGVRAGLRVPGTILYAALGFLVWARGLSVVTAIDPGLGDGPLVQLLKDTTTVLIVVTLGVWSGRRLPMTMDLVVVAAAALTGMAILQQFVLGTDNDLFGFSIVRRDLDIGAATVRFQGPTSDANFWARVLIAILPFAIAAIARHRGARRLLFIASTISVVLGIYLTQSRAGFVAAGLTVFVVLVIAGGRSRRALISAPLVVAILILNPATGPRLATLIDVTRSSDDVSDLSIAYREAAQQGGLAMFGDHPLTGVGLGNFDAALLTYIRNGAADLPPTAEFTEIAPHNSYLEMAAEGGIIGLISFLGMLGTAGTLGVIAVVRARRAPADQPDVVQLRWFATAVLASIAGWAVMSVSLHESQLRTMFGLFGLSAAAAIATKPLKRELRPARLPWSMVRNDLVRGALAVCIAAGALLALPVESSGYERTVAVLVEVDEPSDNRFVYLQNFAVRSVSWRRTLAEITTSEDVLAAVTAEVGSHPDITATARRFTSSIEYRIRAETSVGLSRTMDAVSRHAVLAVEALDVPFSLRPLPASPAVRVTTVDPVLAAGATALPILLVAQSGGAFLFRRRRFSRMYRRVRAGLDAQRVSESETNSSR